METLLQDLRFSLRTLWKNRFFTAIAVLALALGIGANSAIFTVINAVLLRPLPYQESDRLMFLMERDEQLPVKSINYLNYLDWKAQNTVFEQLGVFRYQNYTMTGGGDPERMIGSQASADIFPALKVNAQIGRVFTSEEDQVGANPVAVISSGLWERRFGKDEKVIGQAIILNGKSYTLVGVMPPGFTFPGRADIWTPVGLSAKDPGWEGRGIHPGLYGLGRIKPGVTLQQARTEMDTIAARLEQQYPQSNVTARVNVDSLFEKVVGNIRPTLLILMAAVAAVLLIACANVANLLLVRAAKRQKEIALRAALGASRFRLVRMLLTESFVLSIIGGIAGLLLAMWGTSLILALIDPNAFPRFREIYVDGRVLAFTFLISIFTSLFFGLIPAIQASRVSLNETLKEGNRNASGSRHQQRLRGLLVISEMAAAVVLLIGAGLLFKSFYLLQQVELGFETENIIAANISIPAAKYKSKDQQRAFYDQLLTRLATLPGVQSVSGCLGLPLEGTSQTSFTILGQPEPPPGKQPMTEFQIVTSDYFNTMGIRLMRGRNFTPQDTAGSPYVAVVDENFARKHWPNEDALGKQIQFGWEETMKITIVGIAANIKYQGIDVTEQRVLTYLPFAQVPATGLVVALRTSNDPTSLVSALRNEVKTLDPDQPVFNIRTMSETIDRSIASQRLSMTLLGLFASVALLLAAVGIYGVMAFSVTQRTQEIGIRIALGARAQDVIAMVIKQGMSMATIGLIVGLLGSFVLTRAMASLLFGVSATDPLIFVLISILLMIVALFACYLPARRAAKVDPMVALRQE